MTPIPFSFFKYSLGIDVVAGTSRRPKISLSPPMRYSAPILFPGRARPFLARPSFRQFQGLKSDCKARVLNTNIKYRTGKELPAPALAHTLLSVHPFREHLASARRPTGSVSLLLFIHGRRVDPGEHQFFHAHIVMF